MARGKITPRLRFRVLTRDRYRCAYCGVGAAVERLFVDHVVPVVAGGQTVLENLAAACWECNAGKGADPPEAWWVTEILYRTLHWLGRPDEIPADWVAGAEPASLAEDYVAEWRSIDAWRRGPS